MRSVTSIRGLRLVRLTIATIVVVLPAVVLSILRFSSVADAADRLGLLHLDENRTTTSSVDSHKGLHTDDAVPLADQTWSGGASGNNTAWYTTTNWVGGAVPGSSSGITTNTDIATIPTTGTSNPNSTIGINLSTPTGNTHYIGAINFTGTVNRSMGDSSATSGSVQLNGATINSINNVILRHSGTSLFTLQNNGGGTGLMNIVLGNATDNIINLDSSGSLTVSSVISGTGRRLTLGGTGTGTLTLSGLNTYTGPTTLGGGILSVVTIGNGGVAGGIGQATNAAANLVFDGGTLRYTGLNASTNRNFTINNWKTATIDVTSNDLTISGAAAATNGGLTKSGAGLLNLSGNNLYTGETTINPGGALALLGSGSIAASQLIEIKGGAFFDVSVLTTSLTLAPGQAIRASGTTTSGTIATVATKGLTTAADSPLIFTAFNGSTAPLTIQGSGTVTVASGNPVTVNTTLALGVGNYTLIAKGPTGTVAGTAPTSLTVGGSGLAAGTVGSLVITGGQLVLNVAVGDSNPPTINYTSLANTTSTANRVLTATIADDVAVANGALLPRVYFRKNAGAYFSTQCVLQSGNQQSGTYDCTVDHSLIGGVTGGDVVGYYVIAQDTSGNIVSTPAGVVATNVNTVTTPPTPNTYSILQTFNGILDVGAGETITSLTNNGGLFQALNAGVLTGSLVINVTSDLTGETGTHSLNQLTEEGTGGYTIFFQASGGARLIEGASPLGTGLITLNGADRVTFSGLAFGPGGLTFRNTGNAPTFRFINDATFDGVVNCIVEGGVLDLDSGVVLIGNGTTTGNDNISISNSTIRDRTDAAAVPANLIRNSGTPTVFNSNTTLLNNQLINFTQAAILITNTENSSVTGNNISQTAARGSDLFGLVFFGTGTNTVSGNIIRDQNTTGGFTGMLVEVDGTVSISANRIFNIDNSTGNFFPWVGMQLVSQDPGSITSVVNNMVSLVPSVSSDLDQTGILIDGSAGSFNLHHNSVLLDGSGAGDSWAFRRNPGSAVMVSMQNNIFFNDRTGAGNHFAAGDGAGGSGSWSSDHNLFVGTGSTPANFLEYNGPAVDFATWQTGPPARDANSIASVLGSGPFNVGNMFASANDLHLRTIGNNPAINAGTNAGVATDFDGQTRPFGPAPDIGADEVQTATTAAEASISGRIMTSDGRGIRNIRVTVFGGGMQQPVFALTNGFGYFHIDGLSAGGTYVLSVSGKRFSFDPPARVVSLGEDAFDIDFVGEPR